MGMFPSIKMVEDDWQSASGKGVRRSEIRNPTGKRLASVALHVGYCGIRAKIFFVSLQDDTISAKSSPVFLCAQTCT